MLNSRCYRSLLNSRRLIREGRKELNYAERVAQELLPQYALDIQKSEAERDSLLRKKAEEQGKYDKERDRLTRDIGVLDAQLKKTAEKRRHYDDIRIADILHRVEQEQALAEERKRQEAMKAELEKSYQNVVDKYKALFDQIDMDLRAYINNKDRLVNEHREQFVAKKDRMMRELRKAEDESRHLAKDSTDNMQAVIAQLTTEETALKIQKAKVGSENPFAKDMDANEREHAELLAHKTQVETDVREHEQSIDTMRKEAERALEIAELKYQSSLAEPQKHKADVEAEIQQLQTLLEKTKGSFAEWLDSNKEGWQENIGKVVDEESILYNNVLNPQLVPSSAATSLYGVSVNLAAVERKFRTPEELRALANEKSEECAVCVKRLSELQCRHEDDKKALTAKYQSQIRKMNEELAALKAELMLVPQQEKAIKMQSVELKNKLDDWRKRQIAELDERHNAVIAERVNKEEAKRHVEAELQRKLKSLQAEYNRLLKAEQDVLDKFVSEKEQLAAEKKQQVALRKEELQKVQFDELHGKGMDTSALDAYNRRIAELDKELDFIRQHRDEVAVYRNDKVELFDTEPSVRQERKSKAEALSQLESKFRQYRERIELQLGMVQDKQNKQKAELKNLESGLEAAKVFRSDDTLCPIDSNEVAEKTTAKGCKVIVEELKSRIYSDVKSLDNFKRQAQQFLGMFSAHNTFHFNVSPVTEEEFFAFAANLCEFVENDKISEYQKRISGRYTDIILRISKEMSDLTSREGAIAKTINDINRDFEERNFAGVIREIALRPVKTSDQLMLLLLRIKEFADENQYNMGEMDLFATESRQDVNAKAVKYLLAFMKGLLDEPNRKQLQVADTFKLEFRIKENDNDTGWVEKIANVGSDGTDILVKAMVNIMLINVFKEKASKKSGDFKIHCMMDEIGKLHPNNVKGILDFANRRNILLVNSSPTTYNVEDYKYTYLLSKDGRANTKVVQLIKRL